MVKLKLQYFGQLMRRTDLLEKTPILGKIEGWRRRGRQRMRWLNGITNSMDRSLSNPGSWWWTGKSSLLQSIGYQKIYMTEWLNWTVAQAVYAVSLFLLFSIISKHGNYETLNMDTILAYFNSVRNFSSYNFLWDEGTKISQRSLKNGFLYQLQICGQWNESLCFSLGEKLSQNLTSS